MGADSAPIFLRNGMKVQYCFIRENYFTEHSSFINMLDAGQTKKHSNRVHLCISVEDDENRYVIPLRNNLGNPVRKFGRIGHAVPSASRKNAGLDYRYALVVNDDKYIEIPDERKIPRSQARRIEAEFDTIVTEFLQYLKGYKKAVKKRRVHREPLYRVSSLQNYELNN